VKKQSYFIKIFVSAVLLTFVLHFTQSCNKKEDDVVTKDTTAVDSSKLGLDSNFIKAAFEDTSEDFFANDSLLALGEDYEASRSYNNYGNTKRINIAIIGVDGRFGARSGHSDANHILSIMPEIGKVEIISIPRDTHVDCGYDDSTGLNKLTVFYMARGKRAYLDTIARIAHLNSVPYYVEFGFSQAMGILRWLGFNSSKTLQVLRTRKSFAVGDYQRVYNQAQFLRQAMVRNFGLLNGPMRPVVLRGLLALVKTNLTYDKAVEITDALAATDFASSPDNIAVKIRPSLKVNFKVFDFKNEESIESLRDQLNLDAIAKKDTTAFAPADFQKYMENKIAGIIARAAQDTAKSPTAVISRLKNIYDQKVWLQVADSDKSLLYSRQISHMLIVSYLKKKDSIMANSVYDNLKSEEEFFKISK